MADTPVGARYVDRSVAMTPFRGEVGSGDGAVTGVPIAIEFALIHVHVVRHAARRLPRRRAAVEQLVEVHFPALAIRQAAIECDVEGH